MSECTNEFLRFVMCSVMMPKGIISVYVPTLLEGLEIAGRNSIRQHRGSSPSVS